MIVMGVLNVTPDSFSDGGRFNDTKRALAHGLSLRDQGADIVDVGGESTRPGALRVSASEELRRVEAVVRLLSSRGVPVSIDTMHSAVAKRAIALGATYVNDVSGGLADCSMAQVVAESGVKMIVQHWRAHGAVMQESRYIAYDDVVQEVRDRLLERVEDLERHGVARDRIVIDPGIGFSKDADANWRILSRLEELVETGIKVLVGASRKAFLGHALARGPGRTVASARDAATIPTTLRCAEAGVWGVRVHDVCGTRDALEIAETLRDVRWTMDRGDDQA